MISLYRFTHSLEKILEKVDNAYIEVLGGNYEEHANYYKSKAYRDTVDSYNKPSGIHRCSPSIQATLSI